MSTLIPENTNQVIDLKKATVIDECRPSAADIAVHCRTIIYPSLLIHLILVIPPSCHPPLPLR